MADELAGLNLVAQVDGPIDQTSVDAKGEARIVFCADLAGQRDNLARREAFDGDRPHGPGLRRGRRFLLASKDARGNQGDYGNRYPGHWRCLSNWRLRKCFARRMSRFGNLASIQLWPCNALYDAVYYFALISATGIPMDIRNNSNGLAAKVRRGGTRDAIMEAAERLFFERGFGAVSMDQLAEAAGVARRTLYNQFSSKEEIVREMLGEAAAQLEKAFPPGIETDGDVENVLRLVASNILGLHGHPDYVGFLRMVMVDSRQFPWIAKNFASVMDPQTDRFIRYLGHLTDMGILNCRNPELAAHQFMGALNQLTLWPRMTGRESLSVAEDELVDETVRMFLQHYRGPRFRGAGP
jgi:AcrR family transcriptional regulator